VKVKPVGICDFCGGPIKPDEWYHRRGPRQYCSIECRNAGNSHAGEPVRYAKLMNRVVAGRWINPRSLMTQEQISAVQSRASRTARLHEVAEGRWKNPALADEAREKLSRPRKHSGPSADAIDKLERGISLRDLTQEEREAHRAYRRELRRQSRERGDR
jgi:hypothetical protein